MLLGRHEDGGLVALVFVPVPEVDWGKEEEEEAEGVELELEMERVARYQLAVPVMY